MVQLNLSGKQPNHTQQKSPAESKGGSITNQTVGALGALAMFAAVIVIGSCSRSSKPVAVQQPMQPATPVSTPAISVPTQTPPAVQAKAKPRTHRAAMLSYVNREYGVSFSFPRQYSLKSPDKVQTDFGIMGPVDMNFVRPGGLTLAAVEVPKSAYEGTDFGAAFINVSVNSGLTSAECSQFAGEDGSDPKTPAVIKAGETEFSEVDQAEDAMQHQARKKYYHAFKNDTCYEFAMGLATGGEVSEDEFRPVNSSEVFRKLEKILASVKLQPGVVPETQPSAREAAPDRTSTTQQSDAQPGSATDPHF